MQQVQSCAIVPVESFDAWNLDEARLRQRIADDFSRPFDLSVAPLMRASIYRLRDDECVLLLVFDHIISDGWSFWHLIEELDTILKGNGATLPPDSEEGQSSYLSYVREQQAWLHGTRGQKELAYWRAVLDETYPVLNFPEAKPLAGERSAKRRYLHFVLGPELSSNLGKLAQKHHATLYMVLLSGYFALLHRLTGEDQISIGSAMPGRIDRRWRSVVGNFVNLVCLRAALEPGLTVAGLLGKVRTVAMRAMSNQTFPFVELVEQLAPRRDRGRHPYFQTLFVFQNARGASELAHLMGNDSSGKTISWGDHRVSQFWRASNNGAEYFDVALEMIELDGAIAGVFSYAAEVFDAEAIERYIGYFRQILEGMVADDAALVDRLPLFDAVSRRRAIEMSSPEVVDPLPDLCTHELVEAQAARTPDAVAATFGDAQLTYADLNARANQLAHYLRELGAGPDKVVALCGDRSLAALIGLLAVWKAGSAYAPLDPAYPVERIGTILQDSAPVAMLTTSGAGSKALAAALVGRAIDAPVLDLDKPAWIDRPTKNLGRASFGQADKALGAQSLAYLIYTSGSTGRPKGVMVEHRGVVNLLRAVRSSFGIEAGDRVLALTTLSFDIAAVELWLPLTCGAETVLAEHGVNLDPKLLAEILLRRRITHFQATPATWRMLIDSGWRGVPGLTAISTGEALPAALASEIRQRVGYLWNMYGPTETTVWSSAWPVEGEVPGCGVAPIGHPITNTPIYLLDAFGEPVPIGVKSEIFIGGAGVARGYLGLPELTEERFLPDPFVASGSVRCPDTAPARMYRTGDIGRRLADGTIEYFGRNDFQVKIRGFRIELGEIEAQLAAHPGVGVAVATVHKSANGDECLVGYYTAAEASGAQPSADDLRRHLGAVLPAYMVPTVLMKLDSLPLTQSGKLDRKALPSPITALQKTADNRYEPPANELEAAIARIWEQVLKRKRIGRRDDFFELGGHSLSAAMLASRIREILKRETSVATVFAAPTLAEFAACVASAPAERFPEADARSPRPGQDIADVRMDPHIISFNRNPVQRRDAPPTIFGVGNAKIFRPLAIRLEEAGQPFYVVRPLEAELPDVSACRTLEDMAAFYLRLLRHAQPEGPYVLFGFCATAALAFEMARQLDKEAALVIIVDAWAPGHIAKIGRIRVLLARVSYGLRRRLWLLRHWAASSFAERMSLLLRIVPFYGRARQLTTRREKHLEHAAELERMNKHLVKVTTRYDPPSHKLAVLVIRGETQPQGRGMSPTLGWGDFTSGPINAVTTQGDHEEMFSSSNVEALAQAILVQDRLRKAAT